MKTLPHLLFALATLTAASLPAQAKDKASAPSIATQPTESSPNIAAAPVETAEDGRDVARLEPTAPELSVEATERLLQLKVSGPRAAYVGAVIVSLNDKLVAYEPKLPPMLADAAVLGVGFVADGDSFALAFPLSICPAGLVVHLQGLVMDQDGIRASEPQSFVRYDLSTPIR